RDRRRVTVAFDRPGVDELPAGLPGGRQGHELTGEGETGLLGELAPRRLERVVFGLELALRDGPRPPIFGLPEGTSRMDEEDLPLALTPAVEHQSGALVASHPCRSRDQTRWGRSASVAWPQPTNTGCRDRPLGRRIPQQRTWARAPRRSSKVF